MFRHYLKIKEKSLMKRISFLQSIQYLRFIFGLVSVLGYTSASALPDIPWEISSAWRQSAANKNNTIVKEMANSRPYYGTRRVCNKNDHEYGIIMLHGAGAAGIDSITNASRNFGNMNRMMENFANDCALVYVPQARQTGWDWKSETDNSDGGDLVRMINYMHYTYKHKGKNLKVFVIGGSSGAVMAHHIARFHINHPNTIKLAGVVIADGVSSALGCLRNCKNAINAPAGSNGKIVYYHQGNPGGIALYGVNSRLSWWDKQGVISGIGSKAWNLPTLIITSNEPWNRMFPPNQLVFTPNIFKHELSDAIQSKGGRRYVAVMRYEGNPHAPWTYNANERIYASIKWVVSN